MQHQRVSCILEKICYFNVTSAFFLEAFVKFLSIAKYKFQFYTFFGRYHFRYIR